MMNDAERYQWLLSHIRTCQECDLYREDNSSVECGDLTAHLDEPRAAAVGGQGASS